MGAPQFTFISYNGLDSFLNIKDEFFKIKGNGRFLNTVSNINFKEESQKTLKEISIFWAKNEIKLFDTLLYDIILSINFFSKLPLDVWQFACDNSIQVFNTLSKLPKLNNNKIYLDMKLREIISQIILIQKKETIPNIQWLINKQKNIYDGLSFNIAIRIINFLKGQDPLKIKHIGKGLKLLSDISGDLFERNRYWNDNEYRDELFLEIINILTVIKSEKIKKVVDETCNFLINTGYDSNYMEYLPDLISYIAYIERMKRLDILTSARKVILNFSSEEGTWGGKYKMLEY